MSDHDQLFHRVAANYSPICLNCRYIPAVYVSVEALEARGSTPTDAPDAPTSEVPDEVYVAVFDYQSEEAGDLCFAAGEQVKVIKKESEWWTGQIGARSGVFPYNYVELATAAGVSPIAAQFV